MPVATQVVEELVSTTVGGLLDRVLSAVRTAAPPAGVSRTPQGPDGNELHAYLAAEFLVAVRAWQIQTARELLELAALYLSDATLLDYKQISRRVEEYFLPPETGSSTVCSKEAGCGGDPTPVAGDMGPPALTGNGQGSGPKARPLNKPGVLKRRALVKFLNQHGFENCTEEVYRHTATGRTVPIPSERWVEIDPVTVRNILRRLREILGVEIGQDGGELVVLTDDVTR